MKKINFSRLTRKQILESYNKRDYKQTIQLLRMLFVYRNDFLDFLNNNDLDVTCDELKDFRDILYIWTVIDEFKSLLKGENQSLTVAYMQEFDKDYVKEFFTSEEIKIIKEESSKYYYEQKNKILLHNYESGNIEDVMNSLKEDYANHADYEDKIDVNKISYERLEIAPLRELSHIYRYTNFDIKDNTLNYKYAMLKNLISIYCNYDIEYTERYLLRQKKLGIDLELLFVDPELVRFFEEKEKRVLIEIYKNNIRDGLKVNKGVGLYSANEYVSFVHIALNILQLDGNVDEIFRKMKFDYHYTPGVVKKCLNCKSNVDGLKDSAFKKIENISIEYEKKYESISLEERIKKDNKMGLELGKIIEEFLNNGIDVDTYFNKNNLLKSEYEKIKKYVQNYCPDIYNRFVNYRLERIKKAANNVMEALYENPDFNEIDYYAITNIPYKEISDYLKTVNINAYHTFGIFVKRNPRKNSLNEKSIQMIYDTCDTYQVLRDDGSIVQVEATVEDKKYIVSYLGYINAPITIKNISCGLRRLLNGKLYSESVNLGKRITL